METHSIHPPIRERGLADECPRCAEHAETLLDLDNANLRALVFRTRGWMADEPDCFPRSRTELKAMQKVEDHIIFAERAALLGAPLR
jgi:hypothetical protein